MVKLLAIFANECWLKMIRLPQITKNFTVSKDFFLKYFVLVWLGLFFVPQVLSQTKAIDNSLPLPQPIQIIIPSKTPLMLEFTNEVSSKTAVIGAPVQFELAEDLVLDQKVIIPQGTVVIGEIIHVQKSGFGGRAGELILAARTIEFNNLHIKLRSLKPIAGTYVGKNNSDASYAAGVAAAVTVPVLGFAAVFITGGEIVIPPGARATALVAEDTPIDVAVIGNLIN